METASLRDCAYTREQYDSVYFKTAVNATYVFRMPICYYIHAYILLITYRLGIIEYFQSCTKYTLREGWYDSNIWGPLVDSAFQGLDGIIVTR